MNLGMCSQIERHGDRQTTGDWQFEESWRFGLDFLELPIAHTLSAIPATQTPQLPPWKRNWGLGLVIGGLDKHFGAWIKIWGLGLEFWTSDKQSGAWTSNLGLGADCRELWLRYLGLGLVIWGSPHMV